MYYLDAQRDKDGGEIYRTKAGFRYPLSKTRSGEYKVKSGEMIRVCMTSDFFLEEADPWRDEALEHYPSALGCEILLADETSAACRRPSAEKLG